MPKRWRPAPVLRLPGVPLLGYAPLLAAADGGLGRGVVELVEAVIISLGRTRPGKLFSRFFSHENIFFVVWSLLGFLLFRLPERVT